MFRFFILNIQRFNLGLKQLLFFTGLIFSPLSLAKIHIEPYAGLNFTFTNSRPFIEPSPNQAGETVNYLQEGRYYSGLIAGMRIGYSSMGLAVGGDFSVGRWISLYKEGFRPFRGQETITPIGMPGLFISYKLPVFFRVYATFIPITPVHFTSQEGDSKFCKRSTGGKLGISYISLPFVSINLEYLPMYISGENCNSWSHTGAIYANFIF